MQTEREKARTEAAQRGLCSGGSEHDACGVGFEADLKGRQSHRTIEDALLFCAIWITAVRSGRIRSAGTAPVF